MLSSNVEYLSAYLYNSSIVAGGSRDSEWKNGVVGPKLLWKFWRTASILYESICWTAPPKSPYEITDGLVFPFEDGL